MSLQVKINHWYGPFALDIDLASEARLLGLTGASGSGKTSLLNILAGLVRPAEGHVSVGETVFFDSARGLFVPVHRRRIGYVFQDGRLFPHLTVSQNLRYGQWFAGRRRTGETMARVVELLGIEHLLDRRAVGLSGGERQRIAIGRALLSSPNVLLMDEPLASLDESRRNELLPFIEKIKNHWSIPIVYVSHGAAEIDRLADEIVTLAEGRVASRRPGRLLPGSGTAPV